MPRGRPGAPVETVRCYYPEAAWAPGPRLCHCSSNNSGMFYTNTQSHSTGGPQPWGDSIPIIPLPCHRCASSSLNTHTPLQIAGPNVKLKRKLPSGCLQDHRIFGHQVKIQSQENGRLLAGLFLSIKFIANKVLIRVRSVREVLQVWATLQSWCLFYPGSSRQHAVRCWFEGGDF